MKLRILFAAAALLAVAACQQKPQTAGKRTEALSEGDWWVSQWISAADAPVVTGAVSGRENHRSADGASWFRTEVTNPLEIASVTWMATSLGVMQLYVNGEPIGEEVLRPGYTDPRKTRRSFTYNILDVWDTRPGAVNVLSAQVTPGWWADKIVTPDKHEGMLGQKCAFRSVLCLRYTNGLCLYKGTNPDTWQACIAGPVTHAGIFDGEAYDARIPAGFDTPERFTPAEPNMEFDGEILPSEGAEIYLRRDLTLKPVAAYVYNGITGASEDAYGTVIKIRSYKPGQQMTLSEGETLVVDFGQNAAAVPAFLFQAAEGTTLTCLPGEIVNDGNGAFSRGMDGPEGSVHRTNLRLHKDCFRLDYTFAGKGWESYTPACTFFGYRYLSLTATGEVKIKCLSSIPVSSITKEMETGTLTTGDKSINQLISNTIWGQRSNYLSVPTDCPQRNERLGWTADTQVFAETGTFFANTDAFFHKWMRDMRDVQSETGAFPGVAPFGQFASAGKSNMRLGWADAGIIVPWTVWKQFGDTEIIRENWEAMNRFLSHVAETKYDHQTLAAENDNYQWGDWLSYEPLESHSRRGFTPKDAKGKRHPLPEALQYWNYLSACYWALDAGMMGEMAAAIGQETATYARMKDQAKAYIREQFLTPEGTFRTEILNTMQTPALFALKVGVVSGQAKEAMIQRLRANFAEHGGCLQTGFLGTSILMQTLTENGMADIAWNLLFQRKNPSWLYSVDNGATTIWERWNSYTLESGMGPKGMNSFNHYAYGCVGEWLWETAAGISADTAAPGFRHILLRPIPDKRLGHLDAVYHSAAGPIRSSWKYKGDKCHWTFSIPKGARATVTLPGAAESREYGPGTYTLSF